MTRKSKSGADNITRRTVLAGAAAGAAIAMTARQGSAADDFLAQGREVFTNGTTKADNRKAQDLFEQALGVDPNSASAKALLAHTYIKDWRHNWWIESEEKSLADAEALAIAAVALDGTNVDAHTSRAIVHLVKGQFDDAQIEYDAALSNSAKPPDPELQAEIGFAYIYMDRKIDGLALIKEAVGQKPSHPWWFDSVLAWAHYQRQEYNDGIKVLTALEKPVNDVRMILAACYAKLGDIQKARETMAEFLNGEQWTIADEMGAAFKVTADETHWLDGLRAADMPEGSGKTLQP